MPVLALVLESLLASDGTLENLSQTENRMEEILGGQKLLISSSWYKPFCNQIAQSEISLFMETIKVLLKIEKMNKAEIGKSTPFSVKFIASQVLNNAISMSNMCVAKSTQPICPHTESSLLGTLFYLESISW